MQVPATPQEISHYIWDQRYRFRRDGLPVDATPDDSWRRVARALAGTEATHAEDWAERFFGVLRTLEFIPGGRILAGAGTDQRVTLFNCFVMGVIEDSMEGIFKALREGAMTLQQGGGVGYDFSTLRPHGMPARATGGVASGPVSFMEVWDSMSATLTSTGYRRGAMMATLRCDHPDIEHFIAAKHTPGTLSHFNISVQVSDDFITAARRDEPWPLVFPADADARATTGETVLRRWTGHTEPVPCRVHRVVPARGLWRSLARSAHGHSEPGALFVDRINRGNTLWYREQLSATNPCGEIPLPPYGACDLGSINLCAFVRAPFTPAAHLDFDRLRQVVLLAVRMLDNVIELSRLPLPEQEQQARSARRIGLGITGLADALILMGLRYDSDPARDLARRVMTDICHTAYRGSIELARLKGPFPALQHERHLQGEFVQRLPGDILEGIRRHGIRNSHLLAIAPTGTISLLAGNVSSGLEPVFAGRTQRRIRDIHSGLQTVTLEDFAQARWHDLGRQGHPPAFVTTVELAPLDHLRMQACLQPLVDNAISKTLQLPADAHVDDVEKIFDAAYDAGLKGCTVFRSSSIPDAVLQCGSPLELDPCGT